MIAYKFKGADQIPHAFDIIFNSRLYCADWLHLNDPLEGEYAYSPPVRNDARVNQILDQIRDEKKRIRVCSLSETYDSHLLWAHYASGFRGVAIEVELPDDSPAITRVEYRGIFAGVNLSGRGNASTLAESILSSKYREWSYEREVRVLYREEFYKLSKPVSRVVAGHRMEPALFDALNFICHKKGITFNQTGIGDEGIDLDRVLPPTDEIFAEE